MAILAAEAGGGVNVDTAAEHRAGTTEEIPSVVPVRNYANWVVGGIALVAAAALAISLYTNDNIDHDAIRQYAFSEPILDGVKQTVILAVISMAVGIVLGVIVALMRLSTNPVLTSLAALYIWIFRAVPLLVQILVWGNFALLFRQITLGVPFTDWSVASFDSNAVFTVFVAAILGLGLNEGAYMAEVFRAGLLSVDQGQRHAAQCLGMGRATIFRHIILPQAMPVIIPPTGNQFVSMIKATSLVYVIAGDNLLTNAQNISATNLKVLELLFVASIWYLVLVSLATWGQHHLELHFGKGTASQQTRPRRFLRPRSSRGPV